MSESHNITKPSGSGPAPTPVRLFDSDSTADGHGAQAIEVAAMLGDSVVGVKHVMNPRSGRITMPTYAMFGIGALLLTLSAFAFIKGVSTAGSNADSLHQHTVVEKNPTHTFRPKRMSAGFDFMAFGGAIGGIALMTTGLIRLRSERVQPFFRIGRDSDVELASDAAPAGSFAMVAPRGDGFVFNFSAGMSGELSVGGQSTALSELLAQGRAQPSAAVQGATEVPIPHGSRIRVQAGQQTFLVSSVPKPRKQAVPLFAKFERAVLVFFAGSAVAHLALVALLNQVKPDSRALNVELFPTSDPLVRVGVTPPEDPLDELIEREPGADSDPGGTGTAMAMTTGKMGDKTSTRATGQYMMEKTDAESHLARNRAMEEARQAGVLGQLARRPGGAFASITGTADFSSGLEDRDIYGGLLGGEAAAMAGGWGYGTAGMGPGAGGTGWGTVGRGRYGLMGHGIGTGSEYSSGTGNGQMRARTSTLPQVYVGRPKSDGDLDKNIIRRYIRTKLPRIRHCYEKELQVKPELAGTVVTQFQISPLGVVQGASATGIGDAPVEVCVADAIKSIQFPKPHRGGFVNVRYPFTFQPAGT